jgi:hypothetical protein
MYWASRGPLVRISVWISWTSSAMEYWSVPKCLSCWYDVVYSVLKQVVVHYGVMWLTKADQVLGDGVGNPTRMFQYLWYLFERDLLVGICSRPPRRYPSSSSRSKRPRDSRRCSRPHSRCNRTRPPQRRTGLCLP